MAGLRADRVNGMCGICERGTALHNNLVRCAAQHCATRPVLFEFLHSGCEEETIRWTATSSTRPTRAFPGWMKLHSMQSACHLRAWILQSFRATWCPAMAFRGRFSSAAMPLGHAHRGHHGNSPCTSPMFTKQSSNPPCQWPSTCCHSSRGHVGPHMPRASTLRTPRLNLQASLEMEAQDQGPSGERRASTHTRWHAFIWDQLLQPTVSAAHGG